MNPLPSEPDRMPERPSFIRELWDFVRQNKKWWLIPILLLFVLLGALVALSAGGLAPLIYTIF